MVERDLRDVALSVHRARHAVLEDPREWWSVRPEGVEALEGRPVEEQVAGQLAAVRERLERDLRALDRERVLRIDYAGFCANPEAPVVELRRRIGPVDLRNEPVRSFDVARHAPEGPGEQRLCALLAADSPA